MAITNQAPPALAFNLSTGAEMAFTCDAETAVLAAHAQEQGDFNTWDYRARYGHLLEHGERTVACGDWAALRR